jgi:hypothetical protein
MYFYVHWKQDKKLKKRYVGKNLQDFGLRKIAKEVEDFGLRKIAKEIKIKPSLLIKFKFIEQQACKANVLAK